MSIWAKWIEQDGRFLFSLNNNGGHEIGRERHMQLLDACAEGQVIRPDGDGVPEICEPLAPSVEILSEQERTWRTGELRRHEWMVTRHRDEQDMVAPLTLLPEQFGELLTYRQRLRDWPSASAFPDQDGRPVPPDWLLNVIQ